MILPIYIDKMNMLWYRFSRLDRILIIGSAVGLIVATGFLLDDRWIYSLLSSDGGQRVKIGVATKVTNDVRRRFESAFSWSPLDERIDVYQGDSIFTGEQSEAIIMTENGEQIQISANSLIVINAQADSLRLDINFGSVLGQVGKDKKLLIGSKGDVTEFKGDDAVVKVAVGSSKNLLVNVLEGQVEVSSDVGQRTLGPKENAEISEAGTVIEASDVKIEIISPSMDKVFTPVESRDLVFSWKSTYQFFEYTVEIARDPDFRDIVIKEKTNRTLYRPPSLPTSERLFWRVSARLKPNQSPALSPVAGFALAEDSPPSIRFPIDNSTFTFEEQALEDGRTLNLTSKWTTRTVVKRWEVQLAESSDFAKGLRVFEAKENFVELFSLFEGRYYLRIRSKDWPDAAWSETTIFSIRKKAPASLRPPQVLSAEDTFLLNTKYEGYTLSELAKVSAADIGKFVTAIPELAWNSIPGAYSYEIQISSNREFDSLVFQEVVPSTRFGWKSVQLGKFYWRTRSISANNQRGPFTSAQRLEITLAPPTSLTNKEFVEEVTELTQMESAPPPFLLRWTPVLLATEYQIEFDSSPEFKKPLQISTNFPFKKIQAPIIGMYYWRVRALGAGKRQITDWSDVNPYNFKRAFLSPETTKELKALYPNEETIMLIGEGDLKINFRWATPIKSGKYRFQMSQSPNFERTRFDFLTEKSFFLLREALTDGWYYWRLRVETPQFTSPWTTAYKFQIQHEFTPFNFEQSENKMAGQLQQLAIEKKFQDQVAQKEKKELAKAEAKAAYLSLPKLETPEELSSLDSFNLETRGTGAAIKGLEQLDFSAQQQLLKEYPNFEWATVNEATDYIIELTQNNDFKKPLFTFKTNRPSYRWTKPVPGKYQWRVQAIAPSHQPSEWSTATILELNVLRPKLLAPHSIALLPISNNQVTLDWSATPFTDLYDVEIKEGSGNTQRMTTRVPSLKWAPQKSGSFFWRVTPRNSKLKLIHTSSELRNIVVQKIDPQLLKSQESALVFPVERQTIYIEMNENPYLTFMWQNPKQKGTYTLELARDKDFNDLVSRQTTQQNIITYYAPYAEGPLFWRVTLARANKMIWQSGKRSLTIQRGLPLNPTAQKDVAPKRVPSGSK